MSAMEASDWDEPIGFGSLLRQYRLAAGLQQAGLAERARMSANGIGALERGDRLVPQRSTLALLSRALDLNDEQQRAFEAAAARRTVIRIKGRTRLAPAKPGSPKLIDRASELDELTELVRTRRLVTVAGTGGVGKTRLALEAAYAVASRSEALVSLVEWAPVGGSPALEAALAAALDLDRSPFDPPFKTISARLTGSPRIVILDTCEHVIADAATIANALLRDDPNVRIVATSREPLRIGGEHTYRIGPLAIPSAAHVARLCATEAMRYGAIELFVERTQALDRRFALTDDNAAIVATICRRLDGLPLAIELAAERCAMLGPFELCERLDGRFAILVGGRRDMLARQRSLRANIDWSFELLEPGERTLLSRLALVADPFDINAATEAGRCIGLTANDAIIVLGALIDKSIVIAELDANASRFRFLESTRAYALETDRAQRSCTSD